MHFVYNNNEDGVTEEPDPDKPHPDAKDGATGITHKLVGEN